MSFTELNLDSNLLKAIELSGFTTPTEIQREAIPVVLAGRDLMASAQTGTGKTAAFVLPAMQRLLTPAKAPGVGPRVLVLTPTRELANQVNENIRQLGRFCRKHQIRRHMKHVFHPVIGDTSHGDGRHNQFFRGHLHCRRLLLAATRLTLPHPDSGRPMTINAPLDREFAAVIERLGWREKISGDLLGS